MKRQMLPKTIIIPQGVVLDEAPTFLERCGAHYELLIPIGDKHHATLTITGDSLRALTTLDKQVTIS